jgi:predicted enzyme related to lactoylglutathione lyase
MLQDHPIHAYLPALDMSRARAFYEQTLGLTPASENAGGVTYRFAGGTAAFLYPTPNAGSSRASQAFWTVADITQEVTALRQRGVAFERYGMPGEDADGIVTGGGARAAWFKDSEGNILALIQMMPDRPD